MNSSTIWTVLKFVLPLLVQIAGFVFNHIGNQEEAKAAKGNYEISQQIVPVYAQKFGGAAAAIGGSVWLAGMGLSHVLRNSGVVPAPAAADESLAALTKAYAAMATDPATDEKDLDQAALLLKQWRALRRPKAKVSQ